MDPFSQAERLRMAMVKKIGMRFMMPPCFPWRFAWGAGLSPNSLRRKGERKSQPHRMGSHFADHMGVKDRAERGLLKGGYICSLPAVGVTEPARVEMVPEW